MAKETKVTKVEVYRMENSKGHINFVVLPSDPAGFEKLSMADMAGGAMVTFTNPADEIKNGGRSTHEKLGRDAFKYLNSDGWDKIQKDKEKAKTTSK